ncbi:hypothetical protein HYX14_00685 [Candidatus Woesearchaeota archaeon]|nr:hypothetical protein [Candidatus Woesearchaeota archaeon]
MAELDFVPLHGIDDLTDTGVNITLVDDALRELARLETYQRWSPTPEVGYDNVAARTPYVTIQTSN